ncbi:MAG: AraC family ligand binding domain-containing protein [Achromobacter sp.]|uniref:AraC family ligand binding domain-containing protein n=1 Tax=Achromobacter sp. TaxID=134375 RepID=UPI003D006163
MALKHASPLEVIDLFHRQPSLEPEPPVSISLLRTTELQLIRLVLPAGHRMPSHHVPGVLTLQCLAGRVDVETPERQCTLAEGQLVMLQGDEPHSLHAPVPAIVLLTLVHNPPGAWRPRDGGGEDAARG